MLTFQCCMHDVHDLAVICFPVIVDQELQEAHDAGVIRYSHAHERDKPLIL